MAKEWKTKCFDQKKSLKKTLKRYGIIDQKFDRWRSTASAKADRSAQRLVSLEAYLNPIFLVFWLRFLKEKISYFLKCLYKISKVF